MIFLRIASSSESVIENIAKHLLKERMVIDVNIKRNIERLVYTDSQFHTSHTSLMTCKTKGLLFSKIDDHIRNIFPEENLEIYSLPIVHMDWEDTQHLKEHVQET